MPFGVNPKSIIRRTAIGTSSVVIAATVSAIKRENGAAAIARHIGRQRQ